MTEDLLIRMLREEAPAPREEFVRALDERVANGFRGARVQRASDPVWPWEPALWRLGDAWRRSAWVRGGIAVAASTLLVATVVSSMPVAGNDSGAARKQARDGSYVQDEHVTLDAEDYAAAPLAEDRADRLAKTNATYGSSGRGATTSSVSVSGTITDYRTYLLGSGLFLTAPPKQVPQVIADAVEVARDLDGYPGSSTFDVQDDNATGSADLWVPTDSYAEAMARLSRLGEVERTVQNSRDVTASRADVAQQIRDDAARVREFERHADDPDHPQLEALRNQLELRQQRLADLDRRVEMTLVNLKVRGVEPEPEVLERWTIEWAWHEARELVGRMLAFAIVAGAALLVPGIVALVAWVAWRTRRRRMRDRALDDD